MTKQHLSEWRHLQSKWGALIIWIDTILIQMFSLPWKSWCFGNSFYYCLKVFFIWTYCNFFPEDEKWHWTSILQSSKFFWPLSYCTSMTVNGNSDEEFCHEFTNIMQIALILMLFHLIQNKSCLCNNRLVTVHPWASFNYNANSKVSMSYEEVIVS
jgi:hypothetical protein